MRLSEALSDFVGGSHRCIRCLLGCKVPSPHHHPSAPRKPRTTSPSIPPPSFTPAQTPVPQKGRPVASQTPRTPCPSLLHHNATPWVPSVGSLQAGPPTRDPDTTRRVGLLVRTAWISRFAARAAPVSLHARILLWTTSRGPLEVTNDGSYCAPAARCRITSSSGHPNHDVWSAAVSRFMPSFPKALQALPSQRVIEPKQFIKIWRPSAWCRKSRLHATKPCQLG